MSYRHKNLEINKLSIIGAGQIGPDIMLHFAKVFAGHNVRLILLDVSDAALQKAQDKIEKKIAKGIEKNIFKPGTGDEMKNSIRYTVNYNDIAGSEIILEAATESESVKDKIFRQVDLLCGNDAIFLSNSSHMQPEVIFKNVKNQSRCLVAHYFFPADKNPVVEIVKSKDTDHNVVELLLSFYESIGKVPVEVRSSYGYSIDPIFEGLCQIAIMCLEKGWGNEKQIDKVACETLGLGVGPFTALNLTGGNPITAHGLEMMHTLVHPWFMTSKTLHDAVSNKSHWNTASRDEVIDVPDDLYTKLSDEFLGAYFSLASFILELNITSVSDLDMACELALVVKPPFTFMNMVGLDKVYEIVKKFSQNHPAFNIPLSLIKAAVAGKWQISHVNKMKIENIVILTIRRPKVLNAINSEIMTELYEHFKEIEKDQTIAGVVITGFGTKAFISGADINELAAQKTPQEGIANSQHFQKVLNYLEGIGKPVICAYNGFAFGGGNELAMACTLRISKKNLSIAFSQPEVNLGFIPGAGGTQRLPRIIGIEKAAEILRTGRSVSSNEGVELGYIYKEVEGDLIEEAISLIRQILDGKIQPRIMSREPVISNGLNPQPLNLGHLSKKIDEILCRAIYSGGRMKLEDGLKLESQLFGECILTHDMKIGVETFIAKGARAKPEFVNA